MTFVSLRVNSWFKKQMTATEKQQRQADLERRLRKTQPGSEEEKTLREQLAELDRLEVSEPEPTAEPVPTPGKQFSSEGGNQNVATDQGSAIQINETNRNIDTEGDYFEQVGGNVYTGTVIINRDGRKIRVPLQLPPKVPHFKDREAELEQLLQDLQHGEPVTLCGAGGIGKTALASKALWHLTAQGTNTPEQFPDGVLWHSFYTEPRAEAALEQIARVFGEEPQPNPQKAAQRALSGRRVLLCLDGAEDADDLSRVHSVAQRCGLIVTSRKHRDALKDWQDIPTLPLEDAVSLLSDWSKDQSRKTDLIEAICSYVGRLPLAVRLIGRYLRESGETPDEYLEWLQEEPFEALEQGAHRERSVNRLLSRSLDQLSEPARQILPLIGLLAFAPFGVEPLAAALDCQPRPCRKALGELVDYGLLLRDETQRYSVSHALVHTYARQQLSAPAETLERLAGFYAGFAKEQSEQGAEGYARLDIERPHILHLLERCQAQQQWQTISALVGAISNYLDLRGYWTEYQTVLNINLEAARQLDDRKDEGWCLGSLGYTAQKRGDYAAALEYDEQALAIRQEIGDQAGEGATLNNISQIYQARGDTVTALDYLEQSLAIRQEIGDKAGEGTTLNNLATTAYAGGDYATALDYLEQSLAIRQEIGDKAGEGTTLNNISQIYKARGDSATALDYLEQSLAIQQEIGDKAGEGATLDNIGQIYYDRGDYAKASDYYENALTIRQNIGDKRGEGTTLNNISQIYDARGDTVTALDYLEQSLAIRQEIGDKAGEAITCWNIGLIYQDQGDLERAEQYISRTVQIDEQIGHPDLEQDKADLEKLRAQLAQQQEK